MLLSPPSHFDSRHASGRRRGVTGRPPGEWGELAKPAVFVRPDSSGPWAII